MSLNQQKCVPCEGGVPTLSIAEIRKYLTDLNPAWQLTTSGHLHREFGFSDFKSALAFTNQVGAIAEAEGHHPDILLKWGEVTLTIFTHAINGLSLNDFILAAKVDEILLPIKVK